MCVSYVSIPLATYLPTLCLPLCIPSKRLNQLLLDDLVISQLSSVAPTGVSFHNGNKAMAKFSRERDKTPCPVP